MTVRELVLALLQDPMISIDQEVWISNLSNEDQEFTLVVPTEADPDPDGYRTLYVKEAQ